MLCRSLGISPDENPAFYRIKGSRTLERQFYVNPLMTSWVGESGLAIDLGGTFPDCHEKIIQKLVLVTRISQMFAAYIPWLADPKVPKAVHADLCEADPVGVIF